jgi:hypothetical protein
MLSFQIQKKYAIIKCLCKLLYILMIIHATSAFKHRYLLIYHVTQKVKNNTGIKQICGRNESKGTTWQVNGPKYFKVYQTERSE